MRLLISLALLSGVLGADTHTAASCNNTSGSPHVQNAVNAASDGDTVAIPAGSCTWTQALTVSGKGITITGAGTPNSTADTTGVSATCAQTIITDHLTSGYLFTMSPTYGNSTIRVSCMRLLPYLPRSGYDSPIGVSGTCTASGCPNLRIDNITAPTSWAAIGIADDTFADVTNVFGVADHNTIGDVQASSNGIDFINVAHGQWQGVGNWGDVSWATADTFGTNQAFYLENNAFSYAFGTDADRYGPKYGGARIVCRFNTFDHLTPASACTNHGTDTIGRTRGGRQLEFYGNTVTSCVNNACNQVVGTRSGPMLVIGNAYTAGVSLTKFSGAAIKRKWAKDSWGACDGSSAWDASDGTVYFSGTVGGFTGTLNDSSYTITDSGSPGWTTNQWSPAGAPYSFHNVTKGWGYEIASNTSNQLVVSPTGGGSGNGLVSVGDSYQILRPTLCLDAATRGQGARILGGNGTDQSTDGYLAPRLESTGSAGSPQNVLDPIYDVANTVSNNPNHGQFEADSKMLIANRDWFAQNGGQTAQTSSSAPFNGSSGTGWGPTSRRPATCTTVGVGYWDTDKGTWNQSARTYAGGYAQGQLWVCKASNTGGCEAAGSNYWCPYYTPYTYPHPVISGSVSAPTVTTATPPSTIGATTATVAGNVTSDGGAAVTARGTCYGTSSNPTTPCTSDGTGTGSFTSSLTGLNPSTLYHYRAFAENSAGTSYGSDQSFTTSVLATGASVSGAIRYSGVTSKQ